MDTDLRREVQSLLSDMPGAATYCDQLFAAGDHSAYISIGNVLRQYASDLDMRIHQLQARVADCNTAANRLVELSDKVAPKYRVTVRWPVHSVTFVLSINQADRRYSLISDAPNMSIYNDGVTTIESVTQQGDVIVYTKHHQPDDDIDMEPWTEYSVMVIVKPGVLPQPCMDHTYYVEELDDKTVPPMEFSIGVVA